MNYAPAVPEDPVPSARRRSRTPWSILPRLFRGRDGTKQIFFGHSCRMREPPRALRIEARVTRSRAAASMTTKAAASWPRPLSS